MGLIYVILNLLKDEEMNHSISVSSKPHFTSKTSYNSLTLLNS